MTAEHDRLEAARERAVPWKQWGPYLSERQWGTVREDYSEGGDAWNYFSHDQARSRAYRWGEDGLAGISDQKQRLCFALALWNGSDPILKERLFGLTNSEGNHGEDVKEYYFYLDSTPTHSYMKYLYKYPQSAFPYADLVETNRRRGKCEFEYELIDTGVFDEDRYFDVFVEYAKESPQDILIQVTIHNRGPDPAETPRPADALVSQPVVLAGRAAIGRLLRQADGLATCGVIAAKHPELGELYLYCDGDVPLLFTENETNTQRIFGVPNRTPYVKDGINNCVVLGQAEAVNPGKTGTKASAHYRLAIDAGGHHVVRLRLTDVGPADLMRVYGPHGPFGGHFEEVLRSRQQEADEFYAAITPPALDADAANVMRQALAGMLWSKQFYHYDVDKWLEERGSDPFKPTRKAAPRNDHWHHMYNGDVISMPDKWEYPWYAAWDLAFHVLALTLVDPDFGKQQLRLMLRERYMHPNGQIPAYEWNFGDVNPPVHAWSTIFTYRLEKAQTGEGDRDWLKSCFQKLLLNFTWWVNRKDRSGRNVFEGGFLGLDNIGVFDRSAPLPTGGYLEQADGTAWMALYLPEHARNRRGAGDDRSGLRGHGPQVLRALPVDRLGDGAPRARTRACGTRRTASSTTCSGCPTARPSDSRSGRWWACCPSARPRSSRESCWRRAPSSQSGSSGSSPLGPNSTRPSTTRRSPASPAAGWHRSWTRPSSAACWRRCSTRTSSSARSASARCRATTPITPMSSMPAARNTASPTCRRSPIPACSAATRTGAGRSGCRSTP